ncbi:MAG: hypothetical protein P9L99_07395 [Candidatus Lernaella stagnicola]|nr:hypothetical protein [Candidatus Lernaella stagnicola]
MRRKTSVQLFLWALVLVFLMLLLACKTSDGNREGDEAAHDTPRWIQAVNLPWDSYGTTFGIAPWGYLGLASQGPSGWRCETKPGFQGCQKLFWDQNRLGVNVKLRARDENFAHALTFFWFDEMASLGKGEFLDLAGKTVTCNVYFQPSAGGLSKTPNGAVLFLQDEKWNWLESDWWNIEGGGSKQLSLTLDHTGDFDATKVRAVGVKVSTNEKAPASYSYEGDFYIENVTIPAMEPVTFTFDTAETRTENELRDIAGLGAKALRLWVFADGRSGLVFDGDGNVVGLDDKFLADFDEAVRVAASSDLRLVPVLFDFLLGAETKIEHDAVTGAEYPLFGRADLIIDPQKRRSLMENAIKPLFERFGASEEIIAWELMNEPCWLLSNNENHVVIPDGKRPSEIKEGGAVTFAQMHAFFAAIIAQYPSDRGGYDHVFTIGSASHRWVDQWSDLKLGIAQFHLWNGTGQIDEGLSLPEIGKPTTDLPVVVGEFDGREQCREVLDDALALGYAGAWPWAYRSKDAYSLPTLGDNCREAMRSFAVEHSDILNFE